MAGEAVFNGDGVELAAGGEGEGGGGGFEGDGERVVVRRCAGARHLDEEAESGGREGEAEVGAHEGVPVEGEEEEIVAEEKGVDLG